MIMQRNMSPAIVFSFSKKECEVHAMQMTELDFNSQEEKELLDKVFNNAINELSEEDRHLPQVKTCLFYIKISV